MSLRAKARAQSRAGEGGWKLALPLRAIERTQAARARRQQEQELLAALAVEGVNGVLAVVAAGITVDA